MSKPSTHSEAQHTKKSGTVVLVTNHFPYGLYESFLENELPVLTKHFEKVVVVCRDTTSKGERGLHGAAVYRVNPKSSWKENIITAWLCAINAGKVRRYVKDELNWLKLHNKKLTSFVFDDLVHTLVKALQTARTLKNIIRAETQAGSVVLYSYWLNSSALALTFVSSGRVRIVTLSRAHGGDVYEYRNEHGYLPFRRTLLKRLDRVFTISEDAAAYLRRQGHESDGQKVQVARLGTTPAGSGPAKSAKRVTILSCAFMVAVKRVHLLVDTLQQIDQYDIHWIHVGGGPLESFISERAKERLSGKRNITYQLSGSLTNEQLMQLYRETYVDLFVNTSSAEGIPVSIMEAQSFGIPVVAPRVGGIPEIVSEQTGRLFEPDASPFTIANLVSEVLALSPADVKAMRQRCFQNWKTHYNAGKNFSTFAADIQML